MTPGAEGGRRRDYARAAAADAGAGLFAILLDGRAARTPAGAALAVPSRGLAEAIAAEWNAQQAEIRPLTMPLTRLAATAIDRVGPRRAEVVAAVVRYAATDLLCYRADGPPALAARQAAQWQPLLDWAAETLGARLAVTGGIVPVAQPDATLAALGRAVAGHGDLALAALADATQALGSLVLALALAAGRIDADEALALAQADETFQAERWGEDVETTRRRRGLSADLAAAAMVFDLIRK